MDTFVIKSKTLELTFEKEFGNLVGMKAHNQNWNVFDRPHLGRNWELMIPLKGKRNNPVYGYKHRLKTLNITSDGTKAEMLWSELTSEYGGIHNVEVHITVEAINDAIVWCTKIINNDGANTVVETVCSPIIGDIRRPQDSEYVRSFYDGYWGPNEGCIYPIFHNFKPYWGVDIPTQMLDGGTMNAPFYLIRGDSGVGLYVAPYQFIGQFMSTRIRMYPGPLMSSTMQAPKEDFISGKEVYRPFDVLHVPFARNGETVELTPVHMQAFSGDWSAGTDIYKKQRDTKWNWKKPHTPEWARQPHSWLQLQINSPEDELRIQFKDLPEIAKECREYGIKAIQLVGWNNGGQDQNNPSHDPDPRLGTFEDLKNAISACHEYDVKIILFAKFLWADISTEWYRNELYKYAIRDPYGDIHWHGGYQYQTVTQLLDINTKRFTPLCFLSDELRKILVKEFKKTVELGADGILYDEAMTHGGADFCFDETHGHKEAAYTFNMDLQLIDEFKAVAPEDFLICGEGCYDMQMQSYNINYFRMPGRDTINLKRYIRSKDTLHMIAVTGFDDRDVINNCLMHNYIVEYEPFYFKGRPSDAPLTMEYGAKMAQLRDETREYVWDGEYMCKNGAKVYDSERNEYQYYTVFQADNGKYAVVITNYSEENLKVQVKLLNGAITKWKAVGGEWHTNIEIAIPPRTAVVAIG